MIRSLFVLSILALATAGPAVAQDAPATPSAQEYTVLRGNTLWGIAERFYADPWSWPTLFEANRAVITDPALIYPGQVLTIPARAGQDRRPPPMRTDEEPGQIVEADVGAISIRGEGGVVQESVATGPRPTYADTRARTAFYEETMGGVQGGRTLDREPLLAVPPEIARSAPFVIIEGADAVPLGVLHPPSGVVPAGQLRYSARVYDRLVLELTGGRAMPPAGTRLQVYRIPRQLPGGEQLAVVTGVVEVEGPVGDDVRVRVVEQFARMQDGDLARRLPPLATDAVAATRPVQGGGIFEVMAVEDPQPVQGPGDWVFVDTRQGPALQVGDELVVEADPALPPQARLQVVALDGGVATLRIVQLSDVVVETGARLRLDRRLR